MRKSVSFSSVSLSSVSLYRSRMFLSLSLLSLSSLSLSSVSLYLSRMSQSVVYTSGHERLSRVPLLHFRSSPGYPSPR